MLASEEEEEDVDVEEDVGVGVGVGMGVGVGVDEEESLLTRESTRETEMREGISGNEDVDDPEVDLDCRLTGLRVTTLSVRLRCMARS